MTTIRETMRSERERLEREERARQARVNLQPSAETPDQAILRQRNSDVLGVEASPDAPDLQRQERDARILDASPRLRNWFSHRRNAEVSRDDVAELSFWDQPLDVMANFYMAYTSPDLGGNRQRRAAALASTALSTRQLAESNSMGRAFLQGQRQIEISRLSNRSNPQRLRGYNDAELTQAERQRLDALRRIPQEESTGWGDDVAGQIPIMLGSIDSMFRTSIRDARNAWRQTMGDDPNRMLTVQGAVLAPIGAVGATLGGVGGFLRGAPAFMYEQEAGAAFEEYRQFTDNDGNRIDPRIAGEYAHRVGMINALIEFGAVSAGAKITGAAEVANYLIRGGVRDALRRMGYREAVRRFTIGAAGGALNEGLTEVGQESVTIAMGNLAREAQGGEWETLSDEEIAERIWDSFRIGATVGGVFGSVPAGARLYSDVQAVGEARLQMELFDAINDGALASRTRERAPSAFASAVDAMTRDGPLNEVRVDAHRFVAFFQERDQDAFSAADRLQGVGREALEAALQVGGEVTIPMATYASQIVGTEAQSLAEHVRLGPGKFTPAEVKARLELGVDLERATSEAIRLQGEAAKQITQEEAIYRRVISLFDASETFVPDANKALARWWAHSIVVQARAGGIEPEALLNRLGVSMTGPFGDTLENRDVEEVLSRLGPDSVVPRDRVRVARARTIPRRVTQATEAGVVDGLNYEVGDYLVSEDRDGAQPWVVGRELFERTYVGIENGRYGKRADQPVGYYPVGVAQTIQTREGPREANVGDIVMIGAQGEIWPISRAAFDERYETDLAGYDQYTIHPTALRFGSEAEVKDLLQLLDFGADLETILTHPIMVRVQAHADTLNPDDTMPEGYDASDVNTLQDQEYVVDGEPADYEAMLSDALRVAYSYGEVRQQRRATMVIGPFAAGKSTFIKLIAKNTNAAVVDADQVKSYIPEYEDGYNTRATASESAFIRWRVRDAIMSAGDNLVIEHVGDVGKSLLTSKAQLEAQGYTVDVVHIRVSPDEATRRATRRFIETGRYIEPHRTREVVATNLIPQVFEKLIAEKAFSSYVDIDANPPPRQAVIVGQEGALQAAAAIRSAVRGSDAAVQERAGALRAGARRFGFDQGNESSTDLVVFHNLSPENLLFAAKLGGIPVPSLAVTKRGIGAPSGFGSITLIGSREMADPAVNPVYDADVWSQRFPKLQWKRVPSRRVESSDFYQALNEQDKKYGSGAASALWDATVNSPNPQEAAYQVSRESGAMAMWLELGGEVPPVAIEEDVPLRYDFVAMPAWQEFVKEQQARDAAREEMDFEQRRDQETADRKLAVTAAHEAIGQLVDQTYGKLDVRDELRDKAYWIESFDKRNVDEEGVMFFNTFVVAMREAWENVGKRRIDRMATRDVLKDAIGNRIAEYEAFIKQRVDEMFAPPTIKVGRKNVPVTLDNVVDAMTSTRVRAQENHMTFGPGKTRAAAAAKISDVTEMRNRAEWQIVSEQTLEQAQKASTEAMDAFRKEVAEYYGYTNYRGHIDYWNAFDAAQRSLAKIARRGTNARSLSAALSSEGFKNVPESVLKLGLEAARLLLNTPVNYFEAKPQRAVELREFKGAVIPQGSSEAVREALREAGIPFAEYDGSKDQYAQSTAADQFASELEGAFFQEEVPPLYSALLRAIEAIPANTSMSGQEWLDRVIYEPERVVRSVRRDPATNKPMVGADGQNVIDERVIPRRIRLQGVKQEELDWTGPLGLTEWLQAQEGPVSQRDVAAFVAANGVQVRQTVYGGTEADAKIQAELLPLIEEQDRLYEERARLLNRKDQLTSDERVRVIEIQARFAIIEPRIEELQEQQSHQGGNARWSQYTMPGGQNYRELLLHLPAADPKPLKTWRVIRQDGHVDSTYAEDAEATARSRAGEIGGTVEPGQTNPLQSGFKSAHWGELNVLAHVRMNERVDVDGQRTLFIEELQSDWHQQGRERGYKGGPTYQAIAQKLRALGASDTDLAMILTQGQWPRGLAEMIFDNLSKEEIETLRAETGSQLVPDGPFKNNAWAALGVKAIMRIAVEENFDQIAWIKGQHAIDRFHLGTVANKVILITFFDGSQQLRAVAADGSGSRAFELTESHTLENYIGVDAARMLRERPKIQTPNTPRRNFAQELELDVNTPIGGEGMRAFYDKILPNIVSGITKERSDTTIVFDETNPPEVIAYDANGKELVSGSREYVEKITASMDDVEVRDYHGADVEVNRIRISEDLRSRVASDGLPLFQKSKSPRGQIAFQRDAEGMIRRAMIRFYEARNLSTPIHEIGGHLFLETLRIIASEKTATDQARADWQTVLDWFQVTEEQWSQWSTLPERQAVERMRPYHEMFARGFEVYVMEGRSPSMALKAIFAKFKHWMISIYKSIKGIPGAPSLTPEIRAVFDRLQATQEEIEQAREAQGGEVAMTREQFGAVGNKFADKQYRRYLETIELARAEAEAEVEREALGVLMADQKRWWRSEEKKVRTTVRMEMAERPEWVARDWLSGERLPDRQDPIRLNPAMAVEEYGAELVDRLPAGIIVRDVDGMHLQAMATRKVLSQTAPKRMVEVIAEMGGISSLDPSASDVVFIAGGEQAVPVRGRLKRKIISSDGLPLDGNHGIIQRLWKNGYFGARPTKGFMQLAGRGAETADRDSLQIARAMWADGLSDATIGAIKGSNAKNLRELIWKQTGWVIGDDAKWRFEIDTSNAKLKISELRLVRETRILDLEQVLDFPELFDAYPQLRFIPTDVALGKYGGQWMRRHQLLRGETRDQDVWVPQIRVRAGNMEEALSILTHEIQHAIQDIEGFATGGDPATAADIHPEAAKAWIENEVERRFRQWWGTGWMRAVYNNNEEKFKAHERTMVEARAGWEIYNRLAGEVEARDVQNRMRMTRDERREIPPGEYDPRHDRAVKRPDRIVSMSLPGDALAFMQEDANTEDRPTITEFLDRLDADLRGEHVYSIDDFERVAQMNDAERVKDWFAERGVDLGAKPAEIRKQIERAITQLSDEGLDADTVASLVNGLAGYRAFDSGKAMLEALANLPTFDEAVRAETDKRMRDKFGDPLNDGSITDLARSAVHNALREKVIEIEMDATSRATGGRVRPVNAAAKVIADRQMASMSIKQILGFNWFLGNERRQAKMALELAQKGDSAGADQARFRQMVNFHLYRMARDAANEMESVRRYFRRLQKPSIRSKIEPEYVEQIDQLLEQYELRKISGPEHQRRMNLAAWVRSMEERGLGHMVAIDPAVIDNARRQPFDTLMLDEARALYDAIKNIEHLGRLKERLLDAADKRAFNDVIGETIGALEATGPLAANVRRSYSENDAGKITKQARKAHAELTRMEFLFRYLDGQHNGPLWRTLWLPFARAADVESLKMHNAAKQMTAIWDRYSGSERARMFKTRYELPALRVKGPEGEATSFTRAELISIALNVGNEGNVKALVDGFDWFTDPIETDYAAARASIIAELDTVLTQRDWETVQSIWDLIGQFRDEAFQLQEDLTGLRPEAVNAEPITTRYGDFAGGYYPLKFDRTRDLRVEKADAKQEVQEMWGSNWTAPMTRKGHLIERTGSGGRPVKLALTVFSEHVQNVVHDIAYRRAVIDVNRVINDKRFADAFINVAGRAMYDQLAPWLQAIASDRVDPSAFMWKFLQKLRGNTAIAAMGYRISTGLQQLTGILQAVPMLGGPEMMGSLVKIFSRPDLLVEKSRFILSRSEFMRSRVQTFDRDVRENLERMERNDPLFPVQRNAFMLVGMFDWAVSSVVWFAAYDKARAGKVDGIDPINEEQAIRFADGAVRQTQSAGLAQDLPAVMRGSQVNKLLTMFYSYFSVLYNWTAYDQIMNTRKGRLPVHVFIGNMALIYIVAPLIAEMLAGRFGQRDDEDDDEYKMRLASVVARAPFMTVPVVRDMASAFGSFFEYQLSPAQSGPAKIIEALEDAAQGRTFESEDTVKTAFIASGYAFGLPTPQAWITIDYVADYIEGEEQGFDLSEAALRDTR